MKATRKDASGNVPRNSMFRFLVGKDKVPAAQPAVNQNEQLVTLVDNSTGQERDGGVHSEMLEETTVIKSGDQTTQVPKNDHESNKESNNDHTVTNEPDSCKKKQASCNKQSDETERRRATGNESVRSRKPPRRSHHREHSVDVEEAEAEAAAQVPKMEKVNFVMNSEGCFINGKPFDPRMPPKGIAIVVEQKSAESKTQSKKRK